MGIMPGTSSRIMLKTIPGIREFLALTAIGFGTPIPKIGIRRT